MKHVMQQKGLGRPNFSKKKFGGLTIVELQFVLARYRTFDTNAKFVNASEDVVLALRQAQVYGVGVKAGASSCGGVGKTAFDCVYGVHFSTNAPHEIRLFVDANGDGKYSGAGEDVSVITWDNSISIMSLSCGGLPCTGYLLDVMFTRPYPDAVMRDAVGVGSNTSAQILISNGLKTTTTTITSAGQISLQ
jgi:hypothetical protein